MNTLTATPPSPELRRQLKSARANIPSSDRRQAQHLAWQRLQHSPFFSQAQHIASYIAVRGEFETDWINQQIRKSGKQLYLPIVHDKPQKHLTFQKIDADTQWFKNRFGIPEPQPQPRAQKHGCALDLIITPLLGFDRQGHRLGMGGGYYDRSFARLKQSPRAVATRLLGLAFKRQEISELAAQPWDVPLNGILTEEHLEHFR